MLLTILISAGFLAYLGFICLGGIDWLVSLRLAAHYRRQQEWLDRDAEACRMLSR